MSGNFLPCPHCGTAVITYRNPVPTVDIIIQMDKKIILIERRNEPSGWALPGGFVDYGESVEQAAIREAREETGILISDLTLLGVYSDPSRDTRLHTITTVFIARGHGTPGAGDDAANLQLFPPDALPSPLCFDHRRILDDYLAANKSSCSLQERTPTGCVR